MPFSLQQPLRRKLPLLISAIVFVVVAVLSALGYEQVERAMLAAAGQQVANAAQQMSGLLHESALGLRRTAHLVASDTAVVSLLRRDSPSSRVVVERTFRSDMSRMPQIASRSLWTRDGTLRLAIGAIDLQRRPTLTVADSGDMPSPLAARLGPLRSWNGTVLYDVVALAIAGHDTLGYFVETRRLWDGQTLQRIRDLIGAGSAALLLGNKDGSLWSNGTAMVPGPPHPPGLVRALEYVRAGERRVGAADGIASSPWAVAIEVPRAAAVSRARTFLWDASFVAILMIALGALAAWAISRSITRPLDDISRAAQRIAEGDYSSRASVSPHTELGRLAATFNAMAEQVESASRTQGQRALEARASAEQLEAANQELERALADAELARREAERAARAREDTQSLLDAVLATAPIGFALIDPDLRYLRVNEALAKVNGQPAAAHIGRPVREHQPELGAREELLRQVLDTCEPIVDVELLRTDESQTPAERQLRASFFPVVVGAGPPLGIGMFVAETTERRGLEVQLQQAQKMEAVGQLAGGIAHDFNNLLTVITSYGAMLMADMPRESPHATDVQEIMNAANRASSLTRQLLAFSRRQVLQPHVLDLNALTGNLEKMLRRLLREDIQLHTSFDPDLALVNADAGQLEQVIVNLVVNARDAMPRGGKLSIETANVTLGPGYGPMHANATPGSYVLLAVSDTGMGMDKDTQAHIFEPFFTTKPVGQGTGLGLSTVYGIVKQSGGYVWVYSEIGRGTTFKIYLPAVPPAETEIEPEREAILAQTSAPERILLVEDEPNVRRIARRILERNGYTVLEAANGTEALRVLERRREPIALVLTDLVMPEMGGRELAARLRTVSPTSRVLFMSGYTEDAVLRQSVMEPGAIFLDKPFTFDSLLRKVREALAA